MTLNSILIIDDEETDRYLLKRTIQKAQLTEKVYEADDGRIGLEFLSDYEKNSKKDPSEFPPILIFLDINMPRMDGFEFLDEFSKLRIEYPNLNSTCVLICSSSDNVDDKDKAATYDTVKGYMVKMTYSIDDFVYKVKACFPNTSF